jgi:hypothetical protein
MDDDEINGIKGHPQKVIFLNEKREDSQKDEKENGPDEDGIAFKKFNIFVIITLYIHEELSFRGFESPKGSWLNLRFFEAKPDSELELVLYS